MSSDDRGGLPDRPGKHPTRSGWRGTSQPESSRYRWQKDWTRQQDRKQRGNTLRHRLKIAGWSLLAVGLIAAVLFVALFFPKKTPVIAAAVTDYALPLPPNTWVRDDLDRLATLDRRSLSLAELSDQWSTKERGLRALAAQLAKTSPGGPKRNVVIIYLAMHGAVNAAAEPCLLPAGASPLDESSWLTVRELLQTLKDQRLPPSTKKLVVLDAGRMDANWSFGLLYNGFAERLQAVVDDVQVPNLAILNSSGPGQIGRSSQFLNGSVFGYFFWRGLRSAADIEQGGDDNGRVSVRELHNYLKSQVGRWALANRQDVQEPLLVVPAGQQLDFDLAWNEPESVDPAAEPPGESSGDPMAELWQRHHELLVAKLPRRHPLGWQNFEHKLLRMEQLLAGGKDDRRQATDLRAELEVLATALARSDFESFDPHSLPLRPLLKPEPAPSADARSQALRQLADPAAKIALQPAWTYANRAEVAWAWAMQNPQHDKLRRALDFAGKPERDSGPGFVEVHLLRMLDRYLDDDAWAGSDVPLTQALALEVRAQHAAAPADERALPYVRAMLARGDVARRMALDQLFVGDSDALTRMRSSAIEADAAYQLALASSAQWSEAWQTYDRACAELPYLAQWLLRRPAAGAADLDAKAARQLTALWPLIVQLRSILDSPAGTPAAIDGMQAVRRPLAAGLDQFRKRYDDECYRLQFETGVDQKTARDLAEVLAVPLATGNVRTELRAALARVDRELDNRARQAVGYDVPSPSTADAGTAWRQQLAALPIHPAVALLDRHEEGDAAPGAQPDEALAADPLEQLKTCSRAGGRVRTALAAVIDEVPRLLASDARAKPGTPRPALSAHDRCRHADGLSRPAAALLGQLDWAVDDLEPALALRRWDMHDLLLWQAERTATDFWGPAEAGQASFFARAAEDYLRIAERICRAATTEREQLAQRLAQIVAAEKQGLRPVCSPDPLILVDADQVLPQKASLHPAEHWPTGTAALFVRNPAGQTLPVTVGYPDHPARQRRLGVGIGGHTSGLFAPQSSYALAGRQLSNEGSELQVVALFRGHESTTPSTLVHATKGLAITHLPAEPAEPRITVYGELKQRGALTFILDCSGSMSDVVQLDNQKRTRLEVARAALQGLLDDLAASRNYRVAVRVYGHRARWKDRYSNDVIYTAYGQKEQQAAIDAGQTFNVHPSNDVELVLPMGQFGASQNAAVKAVLDQLQPAGETPLYLAVVQSVEQDFRAQTEGQPHIVVITDGVNEQSAGGPPGVITMRQQVEQVFDAHRTQHIRLDIVGFNVRETEQREKLQDLQAIARRTGGGYYSASDPSGLLKALHESLGLSRYVVENGRGELMGEPENLGSTTELPALRNRPQQYIVRLVGAQPPVESESLQVVDSEALELYLTADHRLQMRRYTGSKEQELRASITDLADPLDMARQVFVGGHVPERQGSAVRFPISVQNADAQRFSPRPAEAWIEIRPLGATRQQRYPEYAFFDLDFEPHRPVPVLSCLAPNWPLKAVKAEVRLWCKFHVTEPDKIVNVLELTRAGAASLRLDALPDAALTLRVERGKTAQDDDRVTLTEQYPVGVASLFQLKAQLDPPPRKSEHVYYAQGALVRHIFSYSPDDQNDLNRVRLFLTSRARLLKQAVALPQPLVLTVPDPLLRP